jgi:hypothetical protein
MTKFEVSCSKGSQGEILVIGKYVSGTEPVYVERVVIEELDISGNPVGSWTHPAHMHIDPIPGGYMLHMKMPSGSNVKGARATAYYIVIDKVAKSPILNL